MHRRSLAFPLIATLTLGLSVFARADGLTLNDWTTQTLVAYQAGAGTAKVFVATADEQRNTASFENDATVEAIIGHSNAVASVIQVDPKNPAKTAKGEIRVGLTTLDTGIDMRNNHMRNKFLEVDKYPTAIFVLSSLTKAPATLEPNKPANVTVKGTLSIHGVSNEVIAPATVTYIPGTKDTAIRLPGDLLHVKTTFPIKLSDYQIVVPEMLVMKLSDDQSVGVDVFLSTELPKPKEPAPAKP